MGTPEPLGRFAQPVYAIPPEQEHAEEQDTGELSPERRRAVRERLRDLDTARRRASLAARSYLISGGPDA